MADRVMKASYCNLTLSHRAGQGEKVLGELKDGGVNLLAFTAFPVKAGKAQVDLIAEDMTALKRVARKNGWSLSKTKKGFLIQGDERIGAVHRHVKKLADEKINITAADAMCTGKGRYGMLMWVKPKDYAKAARILKAK
jgi:hypothetical protein